MKKLISLAKINLKNY